MRLRLTGKATLAKAFGIKREKDAEGNERIMAHLKVASVYIRRETGNRAVGF